MHFFLHLLVIKQTPHTLFCMLKSGKHIFILKTCSFGKRKTLRLKDVIVELGPNVKIKPGPKCVALH